MREPWHRTSPDPRRRRNRHGLSLIELMVAVIVLGFGLIGLAAGSGWITRSGSGSAVDPARNAALRTAVEEVRAMPVDSIGAGRRMHGEFETRWSVLERTDDSVLIRFIVVEAGHAEHGTEGSTAASADTLEYRRTNP